jgi:glycosyltransferase involved in cell wall biosynthesis
MKIVSVMNTAARGGAEFAALEMLDALIARGHEAILLSERPDVADEHNVESRAVDLGPKLRLSTWRSLMFKWPKIVRALRDELDKEMPYDVLLVHYKKDQLLARWLPKRLRPLVVWCEWGPIPFPMRKGLPRRMYLNAAKHADVIMAISEGTKQNLIDVGVPAEKITYVPNVMRAKELDFTASGRKAVRAQLDIPRNAFVVGCVSRFHPKKRNDVVVRAVADLDGAHLVMAGEGETEEELRELAEPLGDRAHFVATPGDDIAAFMSAFDVSVFCPSPTEGAPRAVLLGMLARRPPISTGAEGVSALIRDGVGVITSPENDVPALVEALREYQGDKKRRKREGEEARERIATTHGSEVVAKQIEDLWLDFMDRRDSR